jgi:flagellar biosynthesis protein FlhB
VGGVAFTFVQTRAHLWDEKAMPDLSRVFSAERITRLVSKDFAVDLLVGTVKVVAIVAACWGVLRGEFLTLGRLGHSGPAEQLGAMFAGLSKITVRSIALLIVFAGADFALTRWRYRKRHMMTKDEVKREVKEDEGDPQIKGQRKRRHRELVRKNAMAETKRADALIVNPTHIAIAIRYRKDEGGAPKVLAKGKGALAENMREIARSMGIPIVQDIPLARLLYKKVKVGGSVPAETYKAVAAVLAFVYRITGRSQQSSATSGREAQL